MAWARIVVVVYQIVTRSSSFEVYGLADRLTLGGDGGGVAKFFNRLS